jgi:CHASE3 domain sensor protein
LPSPLTLIWTAWHSAEAAAGAEQSRVLIEQANRVHGLLVTAETGQRGYLLTGDPGYLADYQDAVPRIQLAVPLLAAMKAADEKAVPGCLISSTPSWPNCRRPSATGKGRERRSHAIVRSGRGRKAMEEIRATLTRMLDREHARFRDSSESAQRHGFQTRVLAQLFGLLLAGFIWVSGRRINRLADDQEALIPGSR